MPQAKPQTIQESIYEILGRAVNENRSLELRDRFAVDNLFDSLYGVDRKKYYSAYSSFTAFQGDITGLEKCVEYFFSNGSFNIHDRDVAQCIFSLNNAAWFDKIYYLFEDYNFSNIKDIELIKIFVNSSLINLNIHSALNAIESAKDLLIENSSYDSMTSMVISFDNFCKAYTESEVEDFKKHMSHILEIHRNKIIPQIYAIAGPSVLQPSFFYDEGKEFINIALKYVSDDVDKAIELEEFFYDELEKSNTDKNSINAITYSLDPISRDDNVSFGNNVIEIEMNT